MGRFFHFGLFFFLTFFSSIHANSMRGSSAPYISGDGFRFHCDFVFDELDDTLQGKDIQKNGSTIFVKVDLLERFFTEIHPFIQMRYILVSQNGANPAPGSCASYLDDPKLIAWFGQNMDTHHPKMHPIPVGVANRYWPHGNVDVISAVQKTLPQVKKDFFLYMNFKNSTYPRERDVVADLFASCVYSTVSYPKSYQNYLQDLSRSKFVLSPRGYGVDTHRAWESLLMGAIPVMLSSSIDALFDNLPVVIVDNWNDVTEEFLLEKYEEITASSRKYQTEKIYLSYWLDLIDSYKNQ